MAPDQNELIAQAALDVLRDFTERVATAAGVSLTWHEADQVGEPGTPKYNDRLISEVEDALRERDLLRDAVARLRPYRPAIRGNSFEGSAELAEVILGAVAVLDSAGHLPEVIAGDRAVDVRDYRPS